MAIRRARGRSSCACPTRRRRGFRRLRAELLEDLIEGKGIDGEHFLHLRIVITQDFPQLFIWGDPDGSGHSIFLLGPVHGEVNLFEVDDGSQQIEGKLLGHESVGDAHYRNVGPMPGHAGFQLRAIRAVIFGVQKSHPFPKGALAIEYDYHRRFDREFLWKFFRNKRGN